MRPWGKESASRWNQLARPGVLEFLGICVLALLAVWFLHQSWRKWPDPIVDSGPQWYGAWRVSLGAMPYHDFTWNYGPLSIIFEGLLFTCFGPGMMVLAKANLVVYGAIVVLAYLAFRMAWGSLAAFAALAVFISVFSFSMLNGVGNYNYVLPYANETTHGMLLMLVMAFVMVRWSGRPSRGGAFLLGLCGGVAAVLKPEFMLAGGVLGVAALFLRYRQRQPPSLAEYGLILLGVAPPTLGFTAWFAREESCKSALIDSCQAWWFVLAHQSGSKLADNATYMGFDFAWQNLWREVASTIRAVVLVVAIWAAGWFVNRPWRLFFRWIAALGAVALACSVEVGGGGKVGSAFPGLIAIIFVIVVAWVRRDLRTSAEVQAHHRMALALVLLAGAMLARMALRSRIGHFGFVQAALAGMVAAAVIVADVPRWTGRGRLGRLVAQIGMMAMLAIGCGSVVAESAMIRADQTQPVGSGADLFYAIGPKTDEIGALVNWCVERLRPIPPAATLLVLPEGVMINYLSRHRRPLPDFVTGEVEYVNELSQSRPDYVILIWGDDREGGFKRFGDTGQPGEKIKQWLQENYVLEDTNRGRSKWAFILRKKPGS